MVRIYRKDSPLGEEVSEERAADLVANAGYSFTPVQLEDGSGFSGGFTEEEVAEQFDGEVPEYFNLYTSLLSRTEDILSSSVTDVGDEEAS